MTTTKATHAYIGVSPCGCVRAVTADLPGHSIDVGADVAEFIRGGMTIERTTVEEASAVLCFSEHPLGHCPHPGTCANQEGA
jgi:hypothetical protein